MEWQDKPEIGDTYGNKYPVTVRGGGSTVLTRFADLEGDRLHSSIFGTSAVDGPYDDVGDMGDGARGTLTRQMHLRFENQAVDGINLQVSGQVRWGGVAWKEETTTGILQIPDYLIESDDVFIAVVWDRQWNGAVNADDRLNIADPQEIFFWTTQDFDCVVPLRNYNAASRKRFDVLAYETLRSKGKWVTRGFDVNHVSKGWDELVDFELQSRMPQPERAALEEISIFTSKEASTQFFCFDIDLAGLRIKYRGATGPTGTVPGVAHGNQLGLYAWRGYRIGEPLETVRLNWTATFTCEEREGTY